MTEPVPAPTYIYKILPTPPPTPLPAVFPLSDLDRTDGYIHLSLASQLPRTLSRFFTNAEEVSLLKIEYAVVKHELKWEAISSGEEFPHLYRDMRDSDVASWNTLTRKTGEEWPDVLDAEANWLQ